MLSVRKEHCTCAICTWSVFLCDWDANRNLPSTTQNCSWEKKALNWSFVCSDCLGTSFIDPNFLSLTALSLLCTSRRKAAARAAVHHAGDGQSQTVVLAPIRGKPLYNAYLGSIEAWGTLMLGHVSAWPLVKLYIFNPLCRFSWLNYWAFQISLEGRKWSCILSLSSYQSSSFTSILHSCSLKILPVSKESKWVWSAIKPFYLISAVKRGFRKNDVFDICLLHNHLPVPAEEIHYPFWLESDFN